MVSIPSSLWLVTDCPPLVHHGAQSAPYDIFNFTIEMEME